MKYPANIDNYPNSFFFKTGRLFLRPALLLLVILIAGISNAQQGIPDAPNPPRLVNDFASLLSPDQVQRLESKMVAFDDSTSVQISVVIVSSLYGYDKADFAQRLGQKWGVGDKKLNNGFVILIKPKTASEKGEAFIATGYGVEQFLPDATIAGDIVNNEMIPRFRQNDYYGGINAAADVLISLVKGEFKAADYGKSKDKPGGGIIFAIIIIIVVILIARNNNRNHTINRGGGVSGPMFFPWFGGGSGGGFGGFGGGSSGGVFGGFGGGSFGGGGAGGSW